MDRCPHRLRLAPPVLCYGPQSQRVLKRPSIFSRIHFGKGGPLTSMRAVSLPSMLSPLEPVCLGLSFETTLLENEVAPAKVAHFRRIWPKDPPALVHSSRQVGSKRVRVRPGKVRGESGGRWQMWAEGSQHIATLASSFAGFPLDQSADLATHTHTVIG